MIPPKTMPDAEPIPNEELRVATTADLLRLQREAEKRNYNSLLADEVLSNLDPSGKHILDAILFHHHIQTKPAPTHYRCQVGIKVRGSDEPVRGLLDVSIKSFQALPTQTEWERGRVGPPPVWQKILREQSELLQAIRGPNFAMVIGAMIRGSRQFEDRIEGYRALWSQSLRGSPCWWVEHDMVTLLEAASERMPSYALDQSHLPDHSGFAVLERPTSFDPEFSIAALSWTPARIESSHVNGISLTFYSDRFNGWPLDASEILDSLDWPRYVPVLTTTWPFGQIASEPKIRTEEHSGQYREALQNGRKFAASLFLISQQRIATRSSQKPPRADRREAERLNLPSEILIVTLRRPSPHRSDSDDHREVEWTHRWLVSGHWRHLWKKNEPRLTWISPFVKGPSDKPLVIKKRAYRFAR